MIYTIQEGDSLSKIALRFTGDMNRYSEILPLNPDITDADLIIAGTLLNLPDSWKGSKIGVPEKNVGIPVSLAQPSTLMYVAIGIGLAAFAYYYLVVMQAKANPEEIEEVEEEEQEVEE